MLAMIGKHERHHNAELRLWLASDGSTIGDPAVTPWCGDGVETSMALALPDEKLPENPHLALSWSRHFGAECTPQRGAVLDFWREEPTSWKGHVGYYAGESSSNYYVLGCNQRNSVCIAPIAKGRLRGSRWPLTGGPANGRIVQMSGGVRTTNEY
jgi:hypothetical protein